ncbi:hypothetical protein C2E20_1776 [Micractinium conductrix]|uniref:Uncharacterized protein n=1 Tax=Micractinium conductrix TaxID=554055 RepID=A0A2P6VL58_9CHLO|nr:hypothetical protein C2E20_1776 [Micractinium conductrix]|eukprot:PSC74819.1 hypothetical protein C2E20_1776 [Micractinium conductrix]
MSGSLWLEWLSGVARSSGWWGPVPGTHQSRLEAMRLGALLAKEQKKPPGQRDEERVHRLRVQYRERQLWNAQAMVGSYCRTAAAFERPGLECCAAAGWVRQRLAASYRALQDYQHQRLQH